jgi:hypothetical protein
MVEPDLSYVEQPIKILDQKERSTRRAVIKMYKIQRNHHTEEEATWETESYLHKNFPGFLNSIQGTLPSLSYLSESRDKILFRRFGSWVSKRLNNDA